MSLLKSTFNGVVLPSAPLSAACANNFTALNPVVAIFPMSFEQNGWERHNLVHSLLISNVFILTLNYEKIDADHVADLMCFREGHQRVNLHHSQMLQVCLCFRFVFIHLRVFY